ncbi:GP63-like [Trichomonas vaginalis G3]|uniref:GP63-like n=1 Tax=Trichomonas vaginalis (strain ATCC PRA-98 / G3) TaxID=412133 RepID=A2FGF6_TRIV3|nr:regulation of choline O-acetyltransferase protein [Trichomonas vaginalis G3]EAX96020.1 GP63-like [Trichomonas vaginalis G3]KAI5537101.1 regulation of choline O-acetyltransferase protein [Trichomonas vaginalis G3]|eukprot:XP_001308950.1 GP63-like [Trichomonas vaginalis G3]
MFLPLLCFICRHDEINEKINFNFKNRKAQYIFPHSDKWRPIRIKFNYDFLDGKLRSPTSCYKVGEEIKINNKPYKCQQSDILTKEQINAIKVTNDNVIKFVQNTIKVQSLLEPIKVSSLPFLGDFPEMEFEDTDFAIIASTEIEEDPSGTIAAAVVREFLSDSYRPFIAATTYNPAYVPSVPCNITDFNNMYFITLLHELTHALGFMSALFKHFHPINSSTEYGEKALCSFTKYGKHFSFLVTPYAHLFAKKRFGVETFYGDNGATCPSGLELEDFGGSGTAGSHLKRRVYKTETMVGYIYIDHGIPYNRYTDATLSVLMDTGFYQINWANAQPLVFGHQESIDGKPIDGFGVEPPQKSFPEGYLLYSGNAVGFDYRSITNNYNYLLDSNVDCNNSLFQHYCSEGRYLFYNPNKESYIGGDPASDYQRFPRPEFYCVNNTANLPGYLDDYGPYEYGQLKFEHLCGTYKCNDYESFEFSVIDAEGKTVSKTCSKTNIKEEFNHSIKVYYNNTEYIIKKINRCPDPERFCRTMKLSYMNFNKDPFDPNTKVLEGDPQTPPEWTFDYSDLDKELKAKKKKLAIALGVTCGIIVIVVVSIVLCCYFKKKKPQPDPQQSDRVEEDLVNNPLTF